MLRPGRSRTGKRQARPTKAVRGQAPKPAKGQAGPTDAELGLVLAELRQRGLALPSSDEVKAKRLEVDPLTLALPPGKTEEQGAADVVSAGISGNAFATKAWAYMPLHLTELYQSVDAMAERVQNNDLGGIEKILAAQIVTLNVAFTSMIQKAGKTDRKDSLELYARLGLRMQNQCRATAETLATMKAPPVFAKNYQANIANGPQQVNNGGASARAEIGEVAPTKLLEAVIEAERVDTGTARTAARRDSVVATVDAVNGAALSKRKGARGAKRVQGRRTSAGARRRA